MLDTNTRLLKIATADPKTLARVDAILDGTDTATAAFTNEDTRTTTISDAAKRLAVSRPTVRNLIADGRLDAVMLNGTRRVRMQSIVDFANGNRPAGRSTIAAMKRNAVTRTAHLRDRTGREMTK